MSSNPIMPILEIIAMLRKQAQLRAQGNYEANILFRAADYVWSEVTAPYFKTMSFPGALTEEEVREKFRAEDRSENGRRFCGLRKADRLLFLNSLFPTAYKANVYLGEHCAKDGFAAEAVRYKEEDGGESWLVGGWW